MEQPRLDDLISTIRAAYSDDSPLDQLSAAVLTAQHLGELADHLIGHFVDQARRSGASWTDIGQSMGVTKQAAQQRSVPKDDPNMFTRYTEKARAVVVTAQEEARAAHHPKIQPEHLVLGLLAAPTSMAMVALAEQGFDADKIRAALVFPESGADDPGPLVPFAPAGKKAMELSVREALRLGHNYIGTEHQLLALFELDDSPLATLDIDRDKVEKFILDMLAKLSQ
ncbi:ATP-dependent Clp protease ATP-binding subunit ClpA [Alloactinosynnema sp. L-07]|uniref:Clp protease N-terminal domain-containing protein n=1 Tax=Alloactinosynnema sp. L-07 TaxID=1653480 RepID=UPI00065F05B5|nr:Clp protease N-terminal domain-containing protein [Alloactinosynnema sp. L-07]CRK56152.1 ATP-dependent Clp protease ATP-binding subunit ClpA [Alloactinosynnema sp. L-07]